MFWSLFLQMIASILGLYFAIKFIPGVQFLNPFFIFPKSIQDISNFTGSLVYVGAILGFLNFFVKPFLNEITLPFRIITFNLSSLVVAMLIVWFIDIIFPELIIKGLIPLFWTTIFVWGISLFFEKWLPGKPRLKKD